VKIKAQMGVLEIAALLKLSPPSAASVFSTKTEHYNYKLW